MATLTVKKADEKRVKGMGFLSNKGTDNFSGRVITKNGKMTSEQMQTLAELAKEFGSGEMVFTTRLTVEILGIPFERIDEFRAALEKAGMESGGTGAKVRPVVSCKGTTCQYGLIDTYSLSEEIHDRFYTGYREVKLPHKFKIAVGGCPNNCVKPDLNDLGIVGQLQPEFSRDICKNCKKCGAEQACPVQAAKMIDGVLTIDRNRCLNCGRCVRGCYFDAMTSQKQGYKIYIGGRWGKAISQGRALGKLFTDKEEVLKTIEKCILLFREQGIAGERFAQTIERLGFEKVEAELLSDEILSRKDTILKEEV